LKAGALFEDCEQYSLAGSCYFTANDQLKAADMFKKLNQFAQAGECYFKIGKYNEAARMFERSGMMPRAISCYEMTQSWDQLLHSLSRSKDQFKEEERQSLVNKYVPIALNSLYKMLSQESSGALSTIEKDSNKQDIQEMKMRQKYNKEVS